MIELPELWSHQADVKNQTRQGLAKHRAVIVQGEPGFGKTRLSKNIIGETINREPKPNQSGRTLFAVYGRNLVFNACESFDEQPALPHGVLMAGQTPDWSHRVQVGSIDTLLSWYCEADEYTNSATFDLIVYDETHAHFDKFKKFLIRHDKKRRELGLHPAFAIGLSATPQAKGLSDLYGQIITGPTTRWLIDNGHLSPFRYFRATKGRLEKLKKRSGEYTQASQAEAFAGLAGDMVRDWKRYATGRPTIGFFFRRAQAMEAKQILTAAGIRAEYVDGNTPDDQRQSLFKSLNAGYFDYLCNVGIVERGTNIPAVSCIQFCTAIGSLKRYRQMIGRGSRTAEGKTDCIVIDHANNITNHGFFEDQIPWSLDVERGNIDDHQTRPTIECPQCQAIYRGGNCSNCGYEPLPKELKQQGLEWSDAELVEVKPKAERRKPQTNEQILIGALYAAASRNMTWRQVYFIARNKAKNQGVNFTVPKTFEVAGKTYQSIRKDDPAGVRRVTDLFPFLNRRQSA